ncbi:MAG TPA: glycerol-3-phosphate dehydrogenase/oxidase [Longimicrobiales bacterium]|nr:glycerol-3-phosphate dehydrogenase/oxidase [Longimicrobiales bacterium]
MNRGHMVARLEDRKEPWDLLVIGGGATGVGVALDAAARGYDVLLLEARDFGQGTSSRSTKLVHGGVRYLRQGNVPLVMEALRERGILRNNAPHLVRDLGFVVPNYDWWEAPFYGIGLKVYDALAGKYGFGASRLLSRDETLERLPTLEPDGLRGGVIYHDGQFDDARLLIHMVRTAWEQGGVLLNHTPVEGLLKDASGFVCGVRARDEVGGGEYEIRSRGVVNATGVFTDAIRAMDVPDAGRIIAPSQGIHLVLDRRFHPGDAAIMVPHTDDGRVLFAVPWHDRVLVGTTDTPVPEPTREPRPMEEEVEYVLRHAARYLDDDPTRADVRSAFAGLRPLVRGEEGEDTASLSRDHTLQVSRSGLVTITGGKWTTYRKMAEDAVDHASAVAGLELRPCPTRDLPIHGHLLQPERLGRLAAYGSDAREIEEMERARPELAEPLHPRLDLTASQVVWAVREELAVRLEDVLSRRHRALLLDAAAAVDVAEGVAGVMAAETGHAEAWIRREVASFRALAEGYRV